MAGFIVRLYNDVTNMVHSEHTVYADDENGAKEAAVENAKTQAGHDDTRNVFPALRAAVTPISGE